jgi:hypothetical protein
MKPFYVTDSAKRLAGVYPPSEVVGEALKFITRDEKFGFMRLWLAEGIPFAFNGLPMIYEAVRDYVGRRLGVPATAITLIGSGRIGYSMSPLPAFGRPFGKHSDLDLNIIEQQLFSKLEKDYRTWKDDVDTGAVKPRNANEARHWPENIRVLRINLAMGFVDPYMIPSYLKYGTAQMIGQTAWLVLSRMKITSGAPDVRRVSVRVYRDWNSFASRMELNLHHTLRSLVRK